MTVGAAGGAVGALCACSSPWGGGGEDSTSPEFFFCAGCWAGLWAGSLGATPEPGGRAGARDGAPPSRRDSNCPIEANCSLIAIRTSVVRDGTAYFGVGGGVVADSEAESEYAETLDKARGIVAALR